MHSCNTLVLPITKTQHFASKAFSSSRRHSPASAAGAKCLLNTMVQAAKESISCSDASAPAPVSAPSELPPSASSPQSATPAAAAPAAAVSRQHLLAASWDHAAALYLRELVPRFLPWTRTALQRLVAHSQRLPHGGAVVVPCCGPGEIRGEAWVRVRTGWNVAVLVYLVAYLARTAGGAVVVRTRLCTWCVLCAWDGRRRLGRSKCCCCCGSTRVDGTCRMEALWWCHAADQACRTLRSALRSVDQAL
jgi:hypothetical protein